MLVLAGLTRVPVHGRPLPGNLDLGSKCLLVAELRPSGGAFSPDLPRTLIGSQTQKRRVPQPALGGPLHEPYLRHQLRPHPLHLPHLVSRHAAAPAGWLRR